MSFLSTPTSFNNRLVLEEYKNEGGLKTTYGNGGIAMVAQKVALKGLMVLADAKLADGTVIRKGSIAYIREELLHAQPWAKKILEYKNNKCIIADLSNVEVIEPGE